jgi:hypothetical protein
MNSGRSTPASRINPRIAGNLSRARRQRLWRDTLISIFVTTLLTLVAGGAYYLLSHRPATPSSSPLASGAHAVTTPSVATPAAVVPNDSEISSLTDAPPSTSRAEPIVLFADGDVSPFDVDEAADILQPSGTPVSIRDSSESKPRTGARTGARTGPQTRAPAPPDTDHWTAFDPVWHKGLYESTLAVRPQNAIDDLVLVDLRSQGIQAASLCSDETFLRRVYLDVLGTLPTANQAREFISKNSSTKRHDLIEYVLEQPEFADYWAMKWCDILRVKAEFPINLWPQAAQAYHRWIHTAIEDNLPYDQFARELLTASGSNFRVPQVNFYRALQSHQPESIAQVVALTFMGERTENWPAERLAGMSQFFSRVGYKPTGEWKEEIVYFDRRRDGKLSNDIVLAVFPNSMPVEIRADQDPRHEFADWLTDDRNPWFSRVVVNRIWCWLVGRGMIEPVDDIRRDNRPTNPQLLDHLAEELVAADYDLKYVIRMILQSSCYQQSCVPQDKAGRAAEHFAFYHPRRLDAEVLIDAICQITDTTETYMSIIPEPFTFLPETQRAIALPDGSITSSFLETFGRPARDTGLASERNNRLTPSQALHLLNSNHIRDKFKRGAGFRKLLRRSGGRFETVDLLYLTILSRHATEGELTLGGQLCASERGAEDLAWALINSDEFLFRH